MKGRSLADQRSHELNMPLLDHLIIADDQFRQVGNWGWSDD